MGCGSGLPEQRNQAIKINQCFQINQIDNMQSVGIQTDDKANNDQNLGSSKKSPKKGRSLNKRKQKSQLESYQSDRQKPLSERGDKKKQHDMNTTIKTMRSENKKQQTTTKQHSNLQQEQMDKHHNNGISVSKVKIAVNLQVDQNQEDDNSNDSQDDQLKRKRRRKKKYSKYEQERMHQLKRIYGVEIQ